MACDVAALAATLVIAGCARPQITINLWLAGAYALRTMGGCISCKGPSHACGLGVGGIRLTDRHVLSRGATALAAATLLVPTLLFALVAPALAHNNPEYCQQNPADPRCDPTFCEQNPGDPWCWDPNYCERNPADPICQKEPGTPKETCGYTMTSAPPVLGAAPGPAIVTLTCPHHILAGWDCGWKSGTSPLPVDPTPGTPICAGPVEQAGAPPCGKSWTWVVARPDVRTVTAWLRADTWKDANCDGKPDDWNTTNPDGTCALPNQYGPKTGYPSYPYGPTPDGRIDECDMQHYEWQWRSFN